MNVEKAEQAVKNAQNQLDEALRQLNAAKTWRHGVPEPHKWLAVNFHGKIIFGIYPCSADGVIYADDTFGGPGWDRLETLMRHGWRYAEPGEVDIKW